MSIIERMVILRTILGKKINNLSKYSLAKCKIYFGLSILRLCLRFTTVSCFGFYTTFKSQGITINPQSFQSCIYFYNTWSFSLLVSNFIMPFERLLSNFCYVWDKCHSFHHHDSTWSRTKRYLSLYDSRCGEWIGEGWSISNYNFIINEIKS